MGGGNSQPALKEWVTGDFTREIASYRTRSLRGRKLRKVLKRIRRYYLDLGADVNEVDPDKKVLTTVLMLAAMGGHVRVVELLLERGADAGRQNLMKETALSIACAKSFTAVALALINQGESPVNTTDVDGFSPLSWAVINNNVGVARALLMRGASQFLYRDRREPLDIARDEPDERKRKPMLALLLPFYAVERQERERKQFEREDAVRRAELAMWREQEARKLAANPQLRQERRRGGGASKLAAARARRGGEAFDLDEELGDGGGGKKKKKKGGGKKKLLALPNSKVASGRAVWHRAGSMEWFWNPSKPQETTGSGEALALAREALGGGGGGGARGEEGPAVESGFNEILRQASPFTKRAGARVHPGVDADPEDNSSRNAAAAAAAADPDLVQPLTPRGGAGSVRMQVCFDPDNPGSVASPPPRMQSLASPKKLVATAENHQWKTAYNSIEVAAPVTGLFKMAPCLRRPVHDMNEWVLNHPAMGQQESSDSGGSSSSDDDDEQEVGDGALDITDI